MHDLDDTTGAIVDAAMQIHRKLGPGLLESVYEIVLARDLERRGFRVKRQRIVSLNTTESYLTKRFARIYWSKSRSSSR